ncbi:MAG: HNH endonuclease [Myxococcales bacterium]|nr:HNH endonuclease [Myxococcales bacterium]
MFERDGWRCTVPGCSSYRNLHDHHIIFRSAGGSNALTNRTTLCAAHHLRGVHAGVVRCRGEAPADLRFELGVRGDGPPLLRYEPGERIAPALETIM